MLALMGASGTGRPFARGPETPRTGGAFARANGAGDTVGTTKFPGRFMPGGPENGVPSRDRMSLAHVRAPAGRLSTQVLRAVSASARVAKLMQVVS
jgi:hypothetical protein